MTNFIQAFGWRGFKFIWMKGQALFKGEIIATSWILFTQERMLSAKFGWYWRSDSGKVSSMCFSYIFCHYFQVENGVSLCLTKLESPSLCVLCVNFDWNWSIGFGEEDENWKVYRQTDGRRSICNAHLSLNGKKMALFSNWLRCYTFSPVCIHESAFIDLNFDLNIFYCMIVLQKD